MISVNAYLPLRDLKKYTPEKGTSSFDRVVNSRDAAETLKNCVSNAPSFDGHYRFLYVSIGGTMNAVIISVNEIQVFAKQQILRPCRHKD